MPAAWFVSRLSVPCRTVVPPACVSVRVLSPRATEPAPDREVIEELGAAAETSRIPSAMTPLELAMLPRSLSVSVPPAAIVVAPV